MRNIRLLLVIISLITLVACGGLSDKDSDEAKEVDIKNALNDGDYTYVIDELEGKASGKDEKIWLSSAYLGAAGVDFISALESVGTERTIAEKISNISTKAGAKDSYSVIVDMLGSSTFDNVSINTRQAYLGKIYSLLGFTVPGFVCADIEDDFQLIATISGSVDTVLTAGRLVLLTSGLSEIELTKAKIKQLVDAMPGTVEQKKVVIKLFITNEIVENINLHIEIINCGINVLLQGDNLDDIKDDFQEFVSEISGGSGIVSADTLANYIIDEIAK